mgnify:CR=1 FL=1
MSYDVLLEPDLEEVADFIKVTGAPAIYAHYS